MATLAVGGDGIDFPGIVFNCIHELHIWEGPKYRTCDDQRAHSWGLINDPALVDNISELIDKAVGKGRKGIIGDKLSFYVTGYTEFFNHVGTGCDTVTFARKANPDDDGKEHQEMTTKIRKDFSAMSTGLNYHHHLPDNKESQKSLDDNTHKITNGLSEQVLAAKFQNGDDYTNAILDASSPKDIEAEGFWSYIGSRAKVFHPQFKFYTYIKDAVMNH